MEALPLVVDYCSPTMFARVGVMRATNRRFERAFNPVRNNRLGGSGSWRAIGDILACEFQN
jgi:hypothetical protein